MNLNLVKNNFKNNSAILGGGGIYFNNKLLGESPYQNNIFKDNKAYFANDFFTYPVRLQLTNYKSFHYSKTKQSYYFNVVPGITLTSLYFNVVDNYGQTIKSMNGEFFFLYYYLSSYFSYIRYSIMQLKSVFALNAKWTHSH